MPKNKSISSTSHFAPRLSPAAELKALRNTAEHLKKHPDEARAMFVRAGIYTPTGKLTKAYGG